MIKNKWVSDYFDHSTGDYESIKAAFGGYMSARAAEQALSDDFSGLDRLPPSPEGGYISNDRDLDRFSSALADWDNSRESLLASWRDSRDDLTRAESALISVVPRGVWFRVLWNGSYYCFGWHYADGDRVVVVKAIGDWILDRSGLADWWD